MLVNLVPSTFFRCKRKAKNLSALIFLPDKKKTKIEKNSVFWCWRLSTFLSINLLSGTWTATISYKAETCTPMKLFENR